MSDNKKINIACCGLGINSVAGIIEAANRGVIFDHILFANTGNVERFGERKVTYEYMNIYFNNWLLSHGQPEVKVLHSVNDMGNVITLYEECHKLKTLPAIVFGFKTCSQRFKAAPQNKFLNNDEKCKEQWGKGGKVTKWIFYDADEPERAKEYSDEKYTVNYFLVENDLGRYECEQIINNENLPLPPKSSCKFCPSMKPYQIVEIYLTERDGFYEAIELERNALAGGKLSSVKGLGRDWSWWDLIVAYRYFERFKKYVKVIKPIDKRVLKMIKKIRRSKPIKLTPKSIYSSLTSDLVNDLFGQTSASIPCGCYDNAA